MRVLIINCNRERKPQTLLPLGACCIASAAAASGYDTHFLDLTFSPFPLHAVHSTVQRLQPDVIGLSIRNLDNCDAITPYSYLPEFRAIAAACRQYSHATLVLGGAAVSLIPGSMLRYLNGDYAIVGEGEHVFIAVLNALEQRSDPALIPGVVTPNEERQHQSIAPHETDLHAFPTVELAKWLSFRQYRAVDAAYPIQTKRGCQFHCSYCRYPFLEGHQWRLRDPAWVTEEVARAHASGLRVTEFVDSVFGVPTDHVIACCEAVSRLPQSGALCTMELNPSACVPELIAAMNAAHFSSVAITAESGSDAMLTRMQKGFTTHELRQSAQVLRDLTAQKLWIFMIGAPGECEATVRDTARFIATLPPRRSGVCDVWCACAPRHRAPTHTGCQWRP
ncbi:MAG TPA: radical SAM protein [Armatimonadota bacterium]|nr:radical SAM protein [Armatimonadota bacterium]